MCVLFSFSFCFFFVFWLVMTKPLSSDQFHLMKPVGFRFRPTHEELISNYLEPKTRGDNMKDLRFMAEVILCKHEPWDLPGNKNRHLYILYMLMSEYFINVASSYVCVDKSIIKSDDQEWYFFCTRDLKYSSRKCSNRRTKAGFWKSTCLGKPIKTKRTKKVIGMRKTLVFHEKAGPKARRTGWIIYEYDIITNSSLSDKVNANFNFHG